MVVYTSRTRRGVRVAVDGFRFFSVFLAIINTKKKLYLSDVIFAKYVIQSFTVFDRRVGSADAQTE